MTDPYASIKRLQTALDRVSRAADEAATGLDAAERERAALAVASAFSLAQEMWIFKADPAQPAFTDWMAHGRKTAGDSPYTVYLTTPVSPRHTYRLHGNLGQATYFGAQLYRWTHGFNALSNVISQPQIAADADGNFEVVLIPNRDTYYDGFFVTLEPGQALRLTGRLPEKRIYASFVFYDRWYATPDHPRVRCYLTDHDLRLSADGSYTLYVSADDPGQPNWIQTGGLHQGLFSYRYMLADSNPKPAIEVVRI